METSERLADQLDVATQAAQATTDAAIEKRVVYSGESEAECEDCGNPIPEVRRKALPGCCLCPKCAEREYQLSQRVILKTVRY